MNPLPWLDSHRGRYTVVRWLFPRLLAAIYLIAFISWGLQYDGLVGENGILPAKTLLENIHAYESRENHTLFWQLPSIFHWHYTDAFAHGTLITCCVLAVLVIAVWRRARCSRCSGLATSPSPPPAASSWAISGMRSCWKPGF